MGQEQIFYRTPTKRCLYWVNCVTKANDPPQKYIHVISGTNNITIPNNNEIRNFAFWKLVKYNIQKQLSAGILRKTRSENMQQIYRRAPMSKCDFNKVAATLLKSHFGMWALPQICCMFQEHFFLRTPWRAASETLNIINRCN